MSEMNMVNLKDKKPLRDSTVIICYRKSLKDDWKNKVIHEQKLSDYADYEVWWSYTKDYEDSLCVNCGATLKPEDGVFLCNKCKNFKS